MEDSGKKIKTKPNLDPVSCLYIDKTPEQVAADNRLVEFFHWLLDKRTVEELLK